MDTLTCSSSSSVNTQSELDKWHADRIYWEDHIPVMAWLSQFLTLTPTHNDLATASTDGRKLYFCPAHSATLNDEARRFLHAHIIWHCVSGHLVAPLVMDPHRWHLSCDHEVNIQLLQLGVSLPVEALIFPVCVGRSAIKVYHWLADHPDISLETSPDIHPAALWWQPEYAYPNPALCALWRRRAHLTARTTPALPPTVAKYCESR